MAEALGPGVGELRDRIVPLDEVLPPLLVRQMPETVDGMLSCPNSNCITATEPVETSFRVSEKDGEVRLKCKYCEKTFARDAFAQLR